MSGPLIVSFFTKGTVYEKEVEDLRTSCLGLGLEAYVLGVADQGSWQANCCYKAKFILDCVRRFGRSVWWVDADAVVLRTPVEPEGEVDVALYFNDFTKRIARAGTIYCAPTKATERFLKRWHVSCLRTFAAQPDFPFGDQGQLPDVLLGMEELKVGRLPVEYVHIFDRDAVPLEKSVVLHTQASRTAQMAELFWRHLSGRDLKKMRMENSVLRTEFLP